MINFVDSELKQYSNYLKLEVFRLQQLDPLYPFYVKETFLENSSDNLQNFKVSFKCINAKEFPLCFKKYFKLPIHEYDSKFCLEKIFDV